MAIGTVQKRWEQAQKEGWQSNGNGHLIVYTDTLDTDENVDELMTYNNLRISTVMQLLR